MKGNIFFQVRQNNYCRIKLSFIVYLIVLVHFTASCYALNEEAEYSYEEPHYHEFQNQIISFLLQ